MAQPSDSFVKAWEWLGYELTAAGFGSVAEEFTHRQTS
jgi:hypothetical protein